MKAYKFVTPGNKTAYRVEQRIHHRMNSVTLVIDPNNKVFGIRKYGNYRLAVWLGPVWFGWLAL